MYSNEFIPATSQGGKRSRPPEIIVLHHTGSGAPLPAQAEYLRKNASGVSIHALIGKDGHRIFMVEDMNIAYHVGNSRIGAIGSGNPNDMSLGIELANTGSKYTPDPYPLEQVDSCAQLVSLWLRTYQIHAVVPHALIDTRGKYDPYGFPWDTFWGLVAKWKDTQITIK